MTKTARAKWLRRAELMLWVIGVSLLGVTFATAVEREMYQKQQERVVERMMKAASQPLSSSPAAAPAATSGETPPTVPLHAAPTDSAGSSAEAPSHEIPATPVEAKKDIVIATPVDLESSSERDAEPVPEGDLSQSGLLGLIEIPRIGLSAIVAQGDDSETLDRAVGWLPDTSLPGQGGNSAFAAHRDALFRPLENVRIGDVVQVTVPPHRYEYRVESLDVVAPSDVSVLEDRGADELTLITCHPFRYIGPAPNRFIVKATRIN